MKTLQPIGHNVLVRMNDRVTVSEGGIAIPERFANAEKVGTVQAVGEKVEDVAPGDGVFVDHTQGTHYKSGGTDYIIIDVRKLKAKIEP